MTLADVLAMPDFFLNVAILVAFVIGVCVIMHLLPELEPDNENSTEEPPPLTFGMKVKLSIMALVILFVMLFILGGLTYLKFPYAATGAVIASLILLPTFMQKVSALRNKKRSHRKRIR